MSKFGYHYQLPTLFHHKLLRAHEHTSTYHVQAPPPNKQHLNSANKITNTGDYYPTLLLYSYTGSCDYTNIGTV